MSNYIPLFYMDVITYPFPNPDSGLAKSGPWRSIYKIFSGDLLLYIDEIHLSIPWNIFGGSAYVID